MANGSVETLELDGDKSAEFNKLVEEYNVIKNTIKELRLAEKELYEKLLVYFDEFSKLEGTAKIDYENGFLSAHYGLRRIVDQELIAKEYPTMPEHLQKAFRVKYEVLASTYKKVSKDYPTEMALFVTEERKKVALTLKKEK